MEKLIQSYPNLPRYRLNSGRMSEFEAFAPKKQSDEARRNPNKPRGAGILKSASIARLGSGERGNDNDDYNPAIKERPKYKTPTFQLRQNIFFNQDLFNKRKQLQRNLEKLSTAGSNEIELEKLLKDDFREDTEEAEEREREEQLAAKRTKHKNLKFISSYSKLEIPKICKKIEIFHFLVFIIIRPS